jgi:hypothetical protein
VKVICVSNKVFERLPLTIGKMYDVIKKTHIPFSPSRYDDPSGPFYLVKCDNGEEKSFEANRFRELTLDEKRELKLNDILN